MHEGLRKQIWFLLDPCMGLKKVPQGRGVLKQYQYNITTHGVETTKLPAETEFEARAKGEISKGLGVQMATGF